MDLVIQKGNRIQDEENNPKAERQMQHLSNRENRQGNDNMTHKTQSEHIL